LEKNFKEEKMSKFGDRIYRLRKKRNLTLVEASKKIGISDAYLGQLEKGHRESPTVPVFKKICATYGAKPENILGLF
jgi:transcriptional regulator with XRE-family HTH domain